MDKFKEHIYSWLTELEEDTAAAFLSQCEINQIYIDTLFSMDSDMESYLYEVIIDVPLKTYRRLDEYSLETKAIESAIRESGESEGIHVRDLTWRPYLREENKKQADEKAEIITEFLTQEYVNKQIRLMNKSVESNPHLAVGISKELIETCCKHILTEKNIEFDKTWDVSKLVKEANKNINLLPFEVENAELGKASVAKILAGFSNIAHGITELRNSYGTGHGHSPEFKSLDSIYAKLAVSASSELAIFYLRLLQLGGKKI
ncbi:abortive infection family protein [Flavobacterium humidisoli]|uniref:Abortive infection family protein n=1 Tax=Flavobacterium humidisoli TaxID=2937442 RepID=A0ABY4M018_9FLAO|nr:abortive infection family protein [Flavobacterium humidisoli]UPZ17804.1 abortive infection family protein [Flavobacterium humidisoli]